MKSRRLLSAVAVVTVALCLWPLDLSNVAAVAAAAAEPIVNIQLNDGDELGPVKAMMDELVKRGIRATLWVSRSDLVPEWQAYLKEIVGKGCEIGVKADADISKLSYEEQVGLVQPIMGAISACTGKRPKGFRATGFAWNEASMEVADELGFMYFMASVGSPPGEFDSTLYFPPKHRFGVFGVTRALYPDGTRNILCDVPASRRMSSKEYLHLLCETLDDCIATGKALVVQWHPATITKPDPGNPWWQAFIGFLDYLESRRGEVWCATGEDLVVFGTACDC
ncbi:MAG: polysaccharide deacetylase family protein [Betaproteobacteria bacterium]